MNKKKQCLNCVKLEIAAATKEDQMIQKLEGRRLREMEQADHFCYNAGLNVAIEVIKEVGGKK